MTAIRVERRDIAHAKERSAFRNAACRAVRRQVPGSCLVTASRTHLSYVLLDGWRVTRHEVIPLPSGSPEPPSSWGWGMRLAAVLFYAGCGGLGAWLRLRGWLR